MCLGVQFKKVSKKALSTMDQRLGFLLICLVRAPELKQMRRFTLGPTAMLSSKLESLMQGA